MPQARKNQISLEDTPYYHCVSRCVRRAYLCGKDPVSGQNYEHRRGWVEKRLLFLASVFSIDVCAYAVMKNHTHVVLHVDKESADGWSQTEVISRWHKVSKGNLISHMYMDKEKREALSESQIQALSEYCERWRNRLYDISWFMRMLNEPIARQANKEDGCSGRFWEGRFKSQALLDNVALAACMAYVDLNPVRAGVASTPETSGFTSVKTRAQCAQRGYQPSSLLPFVGDDREKIPKGLPFQLTDYLSLVDNTGRIARHDKPCHISEDRPEILTRLGLNNEQWIELTNQFSRCFKGAVGREVPLRQFHKNVGHARPHGLTQSRRLLSAA